MPVRSVGILMCRRDNGSLHVLLVHPGGPFWSRKDLGAWSIPKGEHEPDDSPWTAAVGEFEEETGYRLTGEPLPLGKILQPNQKCIRAFAVEGYLNVTRIKSGTFDIEWPPRSGRVQSLPEIDRAEWFAIDVARVKIVPGPRPFLDRLLEQLGEA
jgi:predicted NUDIX family NTP pyrophosphohydrolase